MSHNKECCNARNPSSDVPAKTPMTIRLYSALSSFTRTLPRLSPLTSYYPPSNHSSLPPAKSQVPQSTASVIDFKSSESTGLVDKMSERSDEILVKLTAAEPKFNPKHSFKLVSCLIALIVPLYHLYNE